MLEQLIREIRAAHAHVFRISVWQDGVYAAHVFEETSACLNVYSLSKNVTAAAVGLACDRGLLRVDEPILSYLQKSLPPAYEEACAAVTIRHLLTQTRGTETGILFEADRYTHKEKDWVSLLLRQPLPFAPGTHFVYDNGNYYLLSCIIESVTGMPLTQFLQETLFDAMDIQQYAWERCPRQHAIGATGLYMTLEDVSKLGQLFLQDGAFAGNQLLSKEWMQEATTAHAYDGHTPYGYGFWLSGAPDFQCIGAHNQMIYISKVHQMVITAQSFDETFPMAACISKIWEEKEYD